MSHTQAHTSVPLPSLIEMHRTWMRAKWAAVEAERLAEEGKCGPATLELSRFLEEVSWYEYVSAAALVDAVSKAVQS